MIKAIPKDFKIPSNISYSQGEFIWDPEFKSDFDLAVYYAGKRPFPESKGQKKVLKWLNSLGLSFEEIKAHRKKIIDKLRQLTNAKGAGKNYPVVVVPPIPQSFKIDDKKDEEEDDSVLNDLDDLLNEIKSEEPESKKGDKKEDNTEEDNTEEDKPEQPKPEENNNLSTDKKESEDLVEEEIDSRILEILGLTEVSDFTYGEYKTLLRERAAAGRMGSSDMSTETIELVTNEFKRVKNKEEGKFKIKPKTINISSVFNKKAPSPQKQQLDPKKLLPPGEEKKNADLGQQKESVEKQSGLDKVLISILGTLNDIKSLLNDQLNADRLAAENLRKRQEISRKRRREDESESKQGKKDADVKSLTLPAFSFFDTIKRYFGNILAGSFVVGLLKWLTDPKNKKSVDNFKEFFINQGPLILGGILALALLPVASTLLGLTGAILGGIPKLIGALKILATPGGLLALGTFLGVTGLNMLYTKAVQKGTEEFEKRMYGEGNASKGRFVTKLWDQYGRIAPENEKEKMTSEEKTTANFLRIYNDELKKRQRIDNKLFELKRDMKAMPQQEWRYKPQIKEKEKELIESDKKLQQMESQIRIGGKSFSELQKQFEEKGESGLPQTSLSKRLYPSQSKQPPQPQTPLMPGLPPSAAQPGTGPAGNEVGSTPIPDQQGLPPLPPTNTLPGRQHYGASRKGGRKHAGVDFDISGPNAKFYSRIGGVVVGNPFRYGDDGWGIDIFNQQLGVYERIAEANKILVKNGQTVQPGQAVAQGESNTGVIHYEIRTKIEGGFENTLDPIAFLRNPTTQQQTAQLSPTTTPGTSITPGTPTFMAPFKMPQGAAGPSTIPSQGISGAAGGSSSSPGQAKVPVFSSEDPNNVTTMVVKGIYNVVG